MDLSEIRIAVVGLGYVGLPLAIEFAKHTVTVGLDISPQRVNRLKNYDDETKEVSAETLKQSSLTITSSPKDIESCNVYIVTVPTPVDAHKTPDLTALTSASSTVGQFLQKGDTVIFESTVFPGATEESCLPILEELSGLTINDDFYLGYSPERINPGDKVHTLANVTKVVAGSCSEASKFIGDLYALIVDAGVHLAPTIRVAEAAKVIENTQRDLNIALMNELSIIFNKLDIDTEEVLAAAQTKWNFLPFRPGLVGGHCIGIDPYYLTYKAQEIGHQPDVILAGRRLNDRMSEEVASRMVKCFAKRGIQVVDARILVLGLTFKEDCPDFRNTKVVDVISELSGYGCLVEAHDPHWGESSESEFDSVAVLQKPKAGVYDGVILAVPHDYYLSQGIEQLRAYGKKACVFFDVKSAFPKGASDLRL